MDRDSVDFSERKQTCGLTGVKLTNAETTHKYAILGENKGLQFKFYRQEIVHFPKPEDCILIPKKFGENDVLYIPGYSEKRARICHIPLAIFRRVPAMPEEEGEFFDVDSRGFNILLAELSYDVERARKLCEVGTIECKEVFDMHRAWLELDKETNQWKRIENKYKPLKLYEIQPIVNTQ